MTALKPSAAEERLAVVELRQFRTRPQRRDEFIELFERHLLVLHREAGATVIGHFRDLDHPDRFVWLRGFADMATRKTALKAVLSSDSWRVHRDAVRALIVDFDDLLLVRTFAARPNGRQTGAAAIICATILSFAEPVDTRMAAVLAEETEQLLALLDGQQLGTFVSANSTNNFARMPIRDNVHAWVGLARLSSSAHATYRAVLEEPRVIDNLADKVGASLHGPPKLLKLAPCASSRLR